jgi:hypothetical protein
MIQILAFLVGSFVHTFQTQDWKSTYEFLKRNTNFGPSIRDTFEVSIKRLDIEREYRVWNY